MSYPFDWIFSSLDVVKHCIKDDFSDFLNKSYYSVIGSHQCNHLLFKQFGIDRFFMHHNPYYDDYEYFLRCVESFKNLMSTKCQKLFFISYADINEDDVDIYKQKVVDFNNFFQNHTINYYMLCLIHVKGINDPPSHYIYNRDNVDIIILKASSINIGTKFENNIDNLYLDGIIKNLYSFELK